MSTPQRIPALDTLRGIALFGILVVNAPFFFQPEGSFGTYAREAFPGWHNRAAEFITTWLFDGKFILIFSFLFGWGFHVQLARNPQTSAPYLRRLLGLFVIGLAHAVFLFVGDILVTYALLGLALYFMRQWSVRQLILGAAAFWAVSTLTHAALGYILTAYPQDALDYPSLIALHQGGSFWQIVDQRITDLINLYIATPFLFAPQVMGMFMLGLATARLAGAQGVDVFMPVARWILKWLWLPALALNALYALASQDMEASATASMAMRGAFVPLLTLVYLSTALIWLQRPALQRWTAVFSTPGKLSLSTYLGQSVLMSALALSYGFALFGAVSPAMGLWICIAVYLVLVLLGHLWLKAFPIGPMEWVLRSITYASWRARPTT